MSSNVTSDEPNANAGVFCNGDRMPKRFATSITRCIPTSSATATATELTELEKACFSDMGAPV